jgi:hypothetical protein
MRRGFTIKHQNPNSSQNNGQKPVVSAPKKTSLVPSAGKVMASVFWDAEGILFNDYFEKGKTITEEYYSNILNRLDERICEKRPGLQKKKIIPYHISTSCHMHLRMNNLLTKKDACVYRLGFLRVSEILILI